MKTGMGKNSQNQALTYPKTREQRRRNLQPDTKLQMRYRRGTWHIFLSTHHKTSCICGRTTNQEYNSNSFSKKRTVEDLLENPEEELGNICGHAQNWLQNTAEAAQE